MTIANAINKIIGQSPFLEEALSEGLINVSSLARQLLPEVERLTKKKVQESAIIMAIHRRPAGQSFRISKGIKTFMNELGDIIVRSGLSDHTFENSQTINTCQRQLMEAVSQDKEAFCTISQGIYETTIVASNSLDEKITEIFSSEKRLAQKGGLSSVTIRLPKNNTEVSGVYYFLLKNLAWAGINVCEIISTSNEVSIIVSEQDVPRAFPILMNLKSKR
ncbi:MAG: aspartate kinase [Bacteroidales bacterium]|nr:aspartate kinase [Bacteroidales bacterium]